jgi:hypothetical protein
MLDSAFTSFVTLGLGVPVSVEKVGDPCRTKGTAPSPEERVHRLPLVVTGQTVSVGARLRAWRFWLEARLVPPQVHWIPVIHISLPQLVPCTSHHYSYSLVCSSKFSPYF